MSKVVRFRMIRTDVPSVWQQRGPREGGLGGTVSTKGRSHLLCTLYREPILGQTYLSQATAEEQSQKILVYLSR